MGIKHVLVAVIFGSALAACNPDGDPAGVEQGEDGVQSRVRAALRDDAATADLAIELDVQDHTVQLNGFVDSPEEKQAAGRVARSVEGVKNVQNNLVVGQTDQPIGQDVDDAAIRVKIEAALVTADDADANQINAEVLEGVVQLSGFVETQAEKQEAARLVRDIAGVRDVKNQIAVRGDADGGDRDPDGDRDAKDGTPVKPNDRDGDGVKNKRDYHDGVGDEKPLK